MRNAHILQPGKHGERPQYCVFVDTESRVNQKGEHKPYLLIACFYDSKLKREYWQEYETDLKQFWYDVARFGGYVKKRVWVFGHNLFYDMVVSGGIPALVVDKGYHVEGYFEKGNTFILHMQHEQDKKVIELVSSTNYFPMTLAKIGEKMDLPKLEFDYQEGSIEHAKVYCRRDVEICMKAVLGLFDMVELEELGTVAKTLPGQAFNAFKSRFLDTEIYIHNNERAIKLERDAYSGGRVECFQVGKLQGTYYYLDVNSMYPYVMSCNNFPVKYKSTLTHINTHNILQKWIENGLQMVARVKVTTDTPVYGISLIGNFIFPIGTFWAVLTTPEIEYGLKHNLISEVAEVSLYENKPIFAEYVEYFYTRRQGAKQAGNKIEDEEYKLFMNSLYGKFGQLADNWTRIADADPLEIRTATRLDLETGEETQVKIFGGSVFVKQGEEEAFNSFPAVAAHVTGYARMTLWDYMSKAGLENVAYCDTDSLFLSEEGYKRILEFVDPLKLGAIKLETDKDGNFLISDDVRINAPKDYQFGEMVKRKGVKKGSKWLENKGKWETTVWPKLSSFIREGQLSEYHNITREKELKGEYNKGWVLKSGKVEQFRLEVFEGKNYLTGPAGELLDLGQVERIAKKYKDNWRGYDEGNI